jgi:outer membrane protein TolC
VESVKNTLETYKRNLKTAEENLKINLQLDGEACELILSDGIEYSEVEFDTEADIINAMESRYDITALKENYNMAQLYFDCTKVLSAASANYQTAYSDLISKEYTYTNTKKLIALSIKNYYNAILNCADNLKLAEKKVDIAKQRYDINKIKFESGMITNTELTKSLNEYVSENISLENAKLSYKMAVEKYQAEITIGL